VSDRISLSNDASASFADSGRAGRHVDVLLAHNHPASHIDCRSWAEQKLPFSKMNGSALPPRHFRDVVPGVLASALAKPRENLTLRDSER
jgi:hypothetical protein